MVWSRTVYQFRAGSSIPDGASHISYQGGHYGFDPEYRDHPVINVTWYGAEAFCTESGKRLPTEAEWEKAARGTTVRAYPWGDQDPSCVWANHYDYAIAHCVGDTTSVGSYPLGTSPYGALDMAGNVWEWVNDWYDPDYYAKSPYSNPPGPATGSEKVVRGGSWNDGRFHICVADRIE